MLSRVAEQIYWLARYLERAENTARLILIRHQLVLDLPEHVQPDWTLLTESLGVDATMIKTKRKKLTERDIIPYLFGSRENPASIVNSVINARENARISRDILPSEIWENINSLYLSLAQRSSKELPRVKRHLVLNSIVNSCQHIVGIVEGSMNHNQVYQFYRLGQAFERAEMGSRIIDAGTYSLHGDKDEQQIYGNVLWISILRSLSAYQMYRLMMKSNINRRGVLEFLFKDNSFPRSIRFCLNNVKSASKAISPKSSTKLNFKPLDQLIDETLTIDETDAQLHTFIDEFQLSMAKLHKDIDEYWF